jgi:leucyl/phenylalanyl-tRNA--protein transferase
LRGLTPDFLLSAYAVGMFPMANDFHDRSIHWIEPRRRGIIPLDSFHVPRSLTKTLRRGTFRLRIDSAFEQVIRSCAEPTPDRPRTWLNEQLIRLYVELHRRGQAHSVEAWQGDQLVGGLYGVELGAAFFGESMFSRVRDSSKAALVELVLRLGAGGFVLLDTQFITEHLVRFGAIEISRLDYQSRLRRALALDARFPLDPQPFCGADWPEGGGIDGIGETGSSGGASTGSAQSITQTS